MENKKTIALTWWWTWWHIFPLLSLYNYLKETWKYNFLWFWEEWWLEEEIAIKNKIPFFDISAWKLRRYFDLRNLYEPWKNLTWIVEGIYYIKKHNIDIVFSKWGYVSLPMSIAAKLTWKKLYIHESDMVSGLSNKIVSSLATKVFYSFPNEKIDWKKHILTWQILNPELIDYITDTQVPVNPKLTVIVIWWSQGSTNIFNAVLKALPKLPFVQFHIVLWEKHMHLRPEFKKFPNTIVHDFLTQKRLGKILKEVDIAITRWWATTLWELYYFGVHSLIVPLKGSAGNHQEQNALYFKENFGSEILEDNEELADKIVNKLTKYKDLRKAWLNLKDFFKPLKIIEKEIENS